MCKICPFVNMANSAMFNVTFTLTCVKQESMSQAIYRLAGKFTFGNHVMHRWTTDCILVQ